MSDVYRCVIKRVEVCRTVVHRSAAKLAVRIILMEGMVAAGVEAASGSGS